jgi:hypothetical protein
MMPPKLPVPNQTSLPGRVLGRHSISILFVSQLIEEIALSEPVKEGGLRILATNR